MYSYLSRVTLWATSALFSSIVNSSTVEFTDTFIVGNQQVVDVCMELQGDSPTFPITVDLFAVERDEFVFWYNREEDTPVSDYDAVRVNYQIVFQDLSQECISVDRDAINSNEALVVHVSNIENADYFGEVGVHIDIRREDYSPQVLFDISQDGIPSRNVSKSGGLVSIRATVADVENNSIIFAWDATDNRLIDSDGDELNDTFVFDPSSLDDGVYEVQVGTIQENGLYMNVSKTHIRVSDDLVEDTDLDGASNETEGNAATLTNRVVISGQTVGESQKGVDLGVGFEPFSLQSNYLQIDLQEYESLTGNVIATDDEIDSVISFELSGLNIMGSQANVVIKLDEPMQKGGTLFTYIHDINRSFLTYASLGVPNDRFLTARSVDSECPDMSRLSYRVGVAEGDDCLFISITDGGNNDTDLLVNGHISFVGMLGVAEGIFDNDDDDDVKPKMEPGSFNILTLFALLTLLAYRIKMSK
ncbi:hypothetical protein ACFOEK_01230 [Litoribrevibacter euphylliae]|uniref:Ig-like domain-containing protein n=1 Tax=Litoribrevibacter euphylliae TaxID=1834034 RepID=A0ABV7H6X9_9GAMM